MVDNVIDESVESIENTEQLEIENTINADDTENAESEVVDEKEMEVLEGQLDNSNEMFLPEAKSGNFFTGVVNPIEFWIFLIIAFAVGGYLGFLWSKKVKNKINK